MFLLSSSYFPPIAHFAVLYGADKVIEDHHEHYIKQTYRSRCYIATANGVEALSIPIVRSGNHTPMHAAQISKHQAWQKLHWAALVSAYENSPYFEYYADDLAPFFREEWLSLTALNGAAQECVCQLLSITPKLERATAYVEASKDSRLTDFRSLLAPGNALPWQCPAYYQVFQDRHGFLPHLSILDLLFNIGPESRLILKDLYQAISSSKNPAQAP